MDEATRFMADTIEQLDVTEDEKELLRTALVMATMKRAIGPELA